MAGFTVASLVNEANTIPIAYKATHPTDGLSGFPAFDWFRPAGTIIGSPIAGTVIETKPARTGNSKVYGQHVRLRGDRGQELFLTHFGQVYVRPGQRIQRGTPLGNVAPYGSASHIHVSMRSPQRVGSTINLAAGSGTGGFGGSRIPGLYELPQQTGGIGSAIGDAAGGIFRGITGTDPGLIGGAADAILPGDPFQGLVGWAESRALRAGMVVGGFVLLLLGLVIVARAAGAPTPGPALAARKFGG